MKLAVDQNPGSDKDGIWFRLIEEFKIPNAAMQWRFCKKDQKILVPYPENNGDINGPDDPRTWGVMAQHQAKLKQNFFQAIRPVIQGGVNVMPGQSPHVCSERRSWKGVLK